MTQFEIYLLNLDKDTERLNEMSKKLYPNRFHRISGIHGNHANLDNYPEIVLAAKYLTPKSAIGCALTHRKAIKTFLDNSNLDYALILEDDATPINNNYMEEIRNAIQNAPSDWDIIKLDYWPEFSHNYNSYPTLLTTAYIINKTGAKKLLDYKVVYHYDVDLNFTNMKIYNSPKVIFRQIWDEQYHSNNRITSSYNPIASIYEGLNFKILRLFDYEFTFADFFLFLFLILIFTLLYNTKMYYKKFLFTNRFTLMVFAILCIIYLCIIQPKPFIRT